MVQNSDQLQSLLLPILIVLIIGIVTIAGWLIWLYTRSRGQNTSVADRGLNQGAPVVAEPSAAAATPAYILGLTRDPLGGWEIHVKGQRYPTLAAVSDPEIRKEVTNALRALAGFAKGSEKQSQPAAPPTGTIEHKVPIERPTSPLSQRLNQQVQPTDSGSAVPVSPATRRITPLHSSLPTIDFAYEINGILEELLAQTPEMHGHAIVLQNTPTGIRFFVDGIVYSEITDIPEAEIQALIRQATREWERR